MPKVATWLDKAPHRSRSTPFLTPLVPIKGQGLLVMAVKFRRIASFFGAKFSFVSGLRRRWQIHVSDPNALATQCSNPHPLSSNFLHSFILLWLLPFFNPPTPPRSSECNFGRWPVYFKQRGLELNEIWLVNVLSWSTSTHLVHTLGQTNLAHT